MDELLFERVKQLKEIEDRLDRLINPLAVVSHWDRGMFLTTRTRLIELRREVLGMVAEAERQHAAF